MRTAEQNRLVGPNGRLQTDIEAHITWLNARLAMLDHDLETLLRASPLWRENDDLLQSAPGIGPVCARTLVLELPELGCSRASRSRRWWAWHHSIATVGRSVGRADDLGRLCSRTHCLVHGYSCGHAL